MPTAMRAKFQIESVTRYATSEVLKLKAVCANGYPADGSDENNTFAKFTPNASLDMMVTNPELRGKFEPGQTYYVDFTPVP